MSTSASRRVLVLNGPNLNLLGQREPAVYGTTTLADISAMLAAAAGPLGLRTDLRQTNHEGQMIDWLHEARNDTHAVILNPGGWTHTSVALHDAVKAIGTPVIEVHISNPHARESFRHTSFVSPVARGVIVGFGADGYLLALHAASRF